MLTTCAKMLSDYYRPKLDSRIERIGGLVSSKLVNKWRQ